MSNNWVFACNASEIEEEDLIRFDHNGATYCIYHTINGFYATAGMCTHEAEHLELGFVMDMVIECPLHQGRFDIATGKALGAPVCVDLKTFAVKEQDGKIFLDVGVN